MKLRNQVARVDHEASEAKGKLLQSEVAREKAEAEWRTLVEQRDKWKRRQRRQKRKRTSWKRTSGKIFGQPRLRQDEPQ